MALFMNSCCDGPRTSIYFTPAPSASPGPNNHPNLRSRSSTTSSQSGTRASSLTPTPLSKPTTPITTPISKPISEDVIVEIILKARAKNSNQQIRIPGVDEALYDRVKTRTDAISERLRYYYDLTSCTIIIDTLPSDIHESVQGYLTGPLRYSLRQWLTKYIPDADVKVSGSVDRDLVTADGTLKGKTPDQGFYIRIADLDLRMFPNVVFEIGYSESHPNLRDDARRWLTETQGEPVLCVILFIFRKPSSASGFSELNKWKAFLEVYERDPKDSTSIKLFNGPTNFVPVQSPHPKFQLALRHLVPQDQIPDGVDPNTIEQFPIEYDNRDLRDAIKLMESKKRRREESNEVVSVESKRRKSSK